MMWTHIVFLLDKIIGPTSTMDLTFSSYNFVGLLVTAFVLATKFNTDHYYPDSCYAQVSGMPVEQLKACEIQFLKAIDWKLMPPKGLLEKYRSQLIKYDSPHPLLSKNAAGEEMTDERSARKVPSQPEQQVAIEA
eukprot:Sspe_Gene.102026::Locus_76717_Transcript_1_1_Confidence_1.000_Length_923::g.102026::m.102026